MNIARKTLAKYGAKIPTARVPGAADATKGRHAAPADAPAKAARDAKRSEEKKA